MCTICQIAKRVQKQRTGFKGLLTTDQLTRTVLLNVPPPAPPPLSNGLVN